MADNPNVLPFITAEGFVIIASIVAMVIVVLVVAGSYLKSNCFSARVNELQDIVGEFEVKGAISGKLLGKEKFTVGVTMEGACIDRVLFFAPGKSVDACRRICAGTDHFVPSSESACLDQCATCVNSNGCITIVPHTTQGVIEKGKALVDGEYLKAFNIIDANVRVFNSPEYGFSSLTLTSPEKGKEVQCLDFQLVGTRYQISKHTEKTLKDCGVTS